MAFVRLRWRFPAEQHCRTIRGTLWRFDKYTPTEVPDGVLGEIVEKYSDVLEQVEEIDGKPGKWKPLQPDEPGEPVLAGLGVEEEPPAKPRRRR